MRVHRADREGRTTAERAVRRVLRQSRTKNRVRRVRRRGANGVGRVHVFQGLIDSRFALSCAHNQGPTSPSTVTGP